MLRLPTTIEDIDKLIVEEVQESIHLDYKRSQAIDSNKFNELAKDVSAFANSDGGLLIYGVREEDHLPVEKDQGVDHKKYDRERIENIITSKVSPRVDGILIAQIPLSDSTSIYAIQIPKSFRGPHQSPDKKYYKRFNFKSEPMEDYEINDVRNRRKDLPPLVNVDIELSDGFFVNLVVSNIGEKTAELVEFELSDELQPWLKEHSPNVFTRGIKYLPPKRSYKFMFESINAALDKECQVPSSFTVSASYTHPDAQQRITDIFHINLEDYWNSLVTESETYEQGKKLKEAIDKLTNEVKELNRHVKEISYITSQTGLDLSITTIRNLKHLISGEEQLEKISPIGSDYRTFVEVLRVDRQMASRLQSFFWRRSESTKLSEVEGMTDELLEEIKKHFILKDDAGEN
jgi:hypothetical protein